MIEKLMKFEQGEATNVEALELFSELVKSGTIRGLQGSYQRQASGLVGAGFLTESGEITEWGRDWAEDADEGNAEALEDEEDEF